MPCADEQFLQELERNVPAKVNERMFPGHGFEMILIVWFICPIFCVCFCFFVICTREILYLLDLQTYCVCVYVSIPHFC